MENHEVVLSPFEGLVVIVPFGEEGLLACAGFALDEERRVILCWYLHVQPLLDHEIILLQAAAGLFFVELEHHVRGAG